MADFKDRLLEVITDKNIERADIYKGTGLSRSALSQYLSGVNVPKSDNLEKLAVFLDVSEAWLLGYDVPQDRNVNLYYSKLNSIGRKKALDYLEDMSKLYKSN